MKQHVSSQAQKETTTLPKNRFLQHTAVQAVPEHKRVSMRPLETHFNHDFSQVRLKETVPNQINKKLTVNKPGDKYEQEADRIAEQVMRIPAQDFQRQAGRKIDEFQQINPRLHRQINKETLGGDDAPPNVHDALQSPGQPLDIKTRTFMENRFGHDFSAVRIHTDSKAAESAADIQAAAYTVGQDIVFGTNKYRTGTIMGRKLLAHELVHVLQQPVDSTLLSRVDEEVTQGEGQVQEMGNIRLVGPAVTLESDLTSSVTGHLDVNWELWQGRSDSSGTLLRRGTFLNGGIVDGILFTGDLYTLRMMGSVSVRENNLILNDAFNGASIAAEWFIQPRENNSGSDAAELIGVPTVRPISDFMTPDRSDWNIVVQDITRSRSDSVQVGLAFSWTKSSSASTQYGGSLDLGGGARASAGTSSSVTFSDGATLFTVFRFEFYTFEIGDVQIRR